MKSFMRNTIPAFLFVFILASCSVGTYYFRSDYRHVNGLIYANAKEKLFMKAHLKNGDVCILKDSWAIDTIQNHVKGYGIRYDFNRKRVEENNLVIPIDSVAIFETNSPIVIKESAKAASLVVLVSLDAIVGLICLTNPKACFGSCPTFYTGNNENIHFANAEGFSSAIAPSLEYADIDALDTTVKAGQFYITMKNEALETHCVNNVRLLACAHKPDERVYQSIGDRFFTGNQVYTVQEAHASTGDITALMSKKDKEEWISLADEKDLCAKEEVILDYGQISRDKDLGILVGFRQSFLSTYLFYNIMGYMGNEVGSLFAKIETDDKVRRFVHSLHEELGGIEVFLWNERSGEWVYQGTYNEKGPIAFNYQLLPLKIEKESGNIKIKLLMSKGSWKIDCAELVAITSEVKPIEIVPDQIMYKGKVDRDAITKLVDPEKYLISLPGDRYKFSFPLPVTNSDYELFLYTKGYYLEWMRDHWLKDQNLLTLKRMYDNPRKFLKREAPRFKNYESQMNDLFWSSRFNTMNE